MNRNKSSKKYISGARESNAGDNFHELWACSKAIELLNPESKLQQLVIEEISEWDLEDSSNEPYLLLGVDMAEYYGGKYFKSCERIVISQVKYSHRNPQKDWTLSRLTRLKGKRNPHSLIKRLADSFNYFFQDFGSEVKNKLEVKLVSNQNISRDLIEAINEAKDKLSDGLDKEYSKTGWFIKQLTDQSEQKIHELYKASDLRSEAFLDFIQVLDFSDCGLDDRIFLRLGLIKKLSDSVTNRRDEKLTALVDLIKKNALPEKRGKSALQQEDVLTSLNVSLPKDLFPASSEFEVQDAKIEIQDHKKLADHIKKHQKTILHGVAGTGKTTTLLELENHLSKKSKIIYYDCYGGGDYLEFGQHRHLPSRAYLQIANQLAIECNMPFLIHDDIPKEDLERELKRRIAAACELLKEDGGILAIAIDAADNSVEAAQQNSEECFVHRLWDLKLPKNCRLVMSSRSGARLQSLQAPIKDVVEFEVDGFKKHESCQHLKLFFPQATKEQCQDFHENSFGIPRVQFYMLGEDKYLNQDESKDIKIQEVIGKQRITLEELFNDRVEAAVNLKGISVDTNFYMSALLLLFRPFTIEDYAKAVGLELHNARRICKSLRPGLVISNKNYLRFRDEDFEKFLKTEFLGNVGKSKFHEDISQNLIDLIGKNNYASKYYAKHLYLAGQYDKLISQIFKQNELNDIEDDVTRLNIEKNHISIAIKAAIESDKLSDTSKLLHKLADLQKTDKAVERLIIANPDLAAFYGDPETVAKLYINDDTSGFYGSSHFKCAAIFARNKKYESLAKDHFKMAQAWLRRRREIPEEERHGHRWRIENIDIAKEAETQFWLNGARSAYKSLARWRPRSAILSACYELAENIAPQIADQDFERYYEELPIPPDIAVILIVQFWNIGISVKKGLVERISKDYLEYLKNEGWDFDKTNIREGFSSDVPNYYSTLSIDFCEMLSSYEVSKPFIVDLLDITCHELPSEISDSDDIVRYGNSAKAKSLKLYLKGEEINFENFIPSDLARKDLTEEKEKKKEKYRELFDSSVLELFKLRIEALNDSPNSSAAKNLLLDYADKLERKSHRYNNPYRFNLAKTFFSQIASDILINIGDEVKGNFEALIDHELFETSYNIWVNWATNILRSGNETDAYDLFDKAIAQVTKQELSASERIEVLMNCASQVHLHYPELGERYYEKALELADGLDDEYGYLITYLCSLIKSQDGITEKQRIEYAARLVRLMSVSTKYFSDSDHIPWHTFWDALSGIHGPTAMEVASRWDISNTNRLEFSIPYVVNELLEDDYIDEYDFLGLLRFAGEYEHIWGEFKSVLNNALESGDEDTLRIVYSTISRWIQKDVLLHHRQNITKKLWDWTKKHNVDNKLKCEDIKRLRDFYDQNITSQTNSTRHRKKDNGNIDWEKVFPQSTYLDSSKYEETLKRFTNLKHSFSYRREFYKKLKDKVKYSDRVEYLNFVVSKGNKTNPEIIVNLLEDAVNDWNYDNAVTNYFPKVVKTFFQNYSTRIISYGALGTNYFDRIFGLNLLKDSNRREVLTDLLAEKDLENFSTGELFFLAQEVSSFLPSEDAFTTLSWSLKVAENRISEEETLSKLVKYPEETDDKYKVLAKFIYTQLGHPDKKIRWRAIHAIRYILKNNAENKLLDHLFNLAKSKKAPANFLPSRNFFYWISARQFLLILCLHLAEKSPHLLTSNREYFIEILESDFNHVLIKGLAKKTANKLLLNNSSIYTDEEKEIIKFSVSPLQCYSSRESKYNFDPERDFIEDEFRFDFDPIDTTRYWYDSLGEIFGYSSDVVCHYADQFIVDELGFEGKVWEIDPLRGQNRYNKIGLRRNDHGSIPQVESLRIYLEYHSMFVAAGSLLKNHPILIGEHDYNIRVWDEWIDRYLPENSSDWYCDMQDPTPLKPLLFGEIDEIEDWREEESHGWFEDIIGFDSDSPFLIVDGNVDYFDNKRSGYLYIHSALVSTRTSEALVKALQTSRHPVDFGIPYKNSDGEINVKGFTLNGWLNSRNRNHQIDKFDPYNNGFDVLASIPSDEVVEKLNLESDKSQKKYFKTSNENLYLKSEIWSDNPQKRRNYHFFSEGYWTQCHIDFLIELLSKMNKSMIFKIELRKHLSYNYKKTLENSSDIAPQYLIYVLHPDGTVKSVTRDFRIRKEIS